MDGFYPGGVATQRNAITPSAAANCASAACTRSFCAK